MKRIEDWLLAFLQQRCNHPGHFVAVDILEGSGDGIEVRYCNRCGAVKIDREPMNFERRFTDPMIFWRRPDPNLWRG